MITADATFKTVTLKYSACKFQLIGSLHCTVDIKDSCELQNAAALKLMS